MKDLAIARQCLKFSTLVYTECDLDEARTSSQVKFGGHLAEPNSVIISFRGTKEPRDYLTDTRFAFKSAWRSYQAGVRVHRGFLGAYLSVQDRIRHRVQAAARIYVTGHSLGGAKAMICALRLQEMGFPVAGVHVFGCPRVGNGAFRALYNASLHDITYRWEAAGDPVPWMPPLLCAYRHAGRAAYLKNDGRVIIDPPLWDHVPAFVDTICRPAQGDLLDLPSNIFGLFDPHALTNYERLFANLQEALA